MLNVAPKWQAMDYARTQTLRRAQPSTPTP